MTLYTALPQRFKETPAITLDLAEDRYSFQAANIAATMQVIVGCPSLRQYMG